MIRRLFTVASVFAFALLATVRLTGEGDPRYSFLGLGFILHPENRMAIRIPGHKIWAFNYAALYIPLTACFLIAVAWNLVRVHRKRPELTPVVALVLSGPVWLAFALLSIAFPAVSRIHLPGDLLLVAAFVVFFVHARRRQAAIRSACNLHPRCHRCRYDLTGNISGICPECGWPISI